MNKNKTWRITDNSVKIPLPNTFQSLDFTCGGIALKSILNYYGLRKFTEREIINELNMSDDGTDPWQFINVIEKYSLKYGLKYKEYNSMTQQQLKYFMDWGKPVIVTVQAWTENELDSYKDVWDEGHWIIAIGYDEKGFYFEDPSLKDVRGFIPYAEFEERWHDTGNEDFPMDHYGLVVWGEKVVHKNLKTKNAEYIA